jgi:hypothetical protein
MSGRAVPSRKNCVAGDEGPLPRPLPRQTAPGEGRQAARARLGREAEGSARQAGAARPLRSLRLAPPPKLLGEVELRVRWDRHRSASDGAPSPPAPLAPRSGGGGRIRSRCDRDRTAPAGAPPAAPPRTNYVRRGEKAGDRAGAESEACGRLRARRLKPRLEGHEARLRGLRPKVRSAVTIAPMHPDRHPRRPSQRRDGVGAVHAGGLRVIVAANSFALFRPAAHRPARLAERGSFTHDASSAATVAADVIFSETWTAP